MADPDPPAPFLVGYARVSSEDQELRLQTDPIGEAQAAALQAMIDRRRTPQEVLIAEYLDAFRAANPGREAPRLVYERGWFDLGGSQWGGIVNRGTLYRGKRLAEMRDQLLARAKEAAHAR